MKLTSLPKLVKTTWLLILKNMIPNAAAAVAVCLHVQPLVSLGDVIPGTGDGLSVNGSADLELQRLRPAVEAFQRGDADGFKVAYSMVAKQGDGFPAMEVFWSQLLVDSGRMAEALTTVEGYLRQSTEDPEAYILLGRVALLSNRWTDAWLQLQYARQLIEGGKLKPARRKYVELPLLELLGQAAERRGQWKVAEEMYLKAIETKPDSPQYHWAIGKVRVFAGDIEQGFQKMSEACQTLPELPEAALSVAQILAETSPWRSDAEATQSVQHWFDKAVEKTPSNSQVWVKYFNWLLSAERAEEVTASFQALPETLQQDRSLQFLRSIAARYLNDLQMAESILVPLHQADPEDPEVANQLALVLVESKDEAKRGRALQLSERNLRQVPNSETVVATAAWIQFRLGASDIADQMLGELAQKVPLSAQSAYYAAELLASRGLTDDSRRMLKAAVESPGLFPQRAAAKAKLGQ